MSIETTFGKDAAGRIDFMKLSRNGKLPVEVRYFYTGDAITLKIKGNKALLPSYAELIAIVDAKFVSRIEAVKSLSAILREVNVNAMYPQFTWEKVLAEGLDLYFDAKEIEWFPPRDVNVPASKRWTQTSFLPPWAGRMVCPATLWGTTWYSKSPYMYGHASFYMRLPTITGFPNAPDNWFGFENGRDHRMGIAGFRWFFTGGVETMWAYTAKLGLGNWVDITALLPANAKTAEHHYEVHIGRNIIEFLLDERIVAVAANCPGVDQVRIDGPPYGLFTTRSQIPAYMTSLVEIAPLGGMELVCELSPMNMRLCNGEAVYPRIYHLYQYGVDVRFVASVIAAGSLSSHPIPLYGYTQKSIFFQATQAGSLVVEIITLGSNWRTIATVAILANTLYQYDFAGQAIFGRVTFTPSAFPCTITEAEAVLA